MISAPRRRCTSSRPRSGTSISPCASTTRGKAPIAAVYKFNAQFDEYLFLPVVRAYEFVTPDFIEERVTDFFSNLSEFRNASNGLMQARPDAAGRAVIRLSLNSTIGVLGLFDVATPMGVTQEPLDFGLTLGRWGTPNGPFLMVPVLGPSNVRDFSRLRRRLGDRVLRAARIDRDRLGLLQSGDLRALRGRPAPPTSTSATTARARRSSTTWSASSTPRSASFSCARCSPASPRTSDPSPFRGPVDVAPVSGSMPHQAPAGRLLP